MKIINLKIKKLKEKYHDKIHITLANKVINDIVSKSNYEEYGARKISKIIKDDLESIIIEALIDNKKEVTIKEIGQTV